MLKHTFSLVVAIVVATLAGSANADAINLSDPSFENGFSGSSGSAESGWFTFGNAFGGQSVAPGTFWNMSNNDGPNAAFATELAETDGGSIYQTVGLDAGVEYRLTAAVGMSASAPKSDGKFALVFYTLTFSSELAATTGSISTRGSFTDYSLSFTPTTTGLYQVGVRNRGFDPGTGADVDESTVFFDNVRLTAVPEPGTVLFVAFGLGGMLLKRRRK